MPLNCVRPEDLAVGFNSAGKVQPGAEWCPQHKAGKWFKSNNPEPVPGLAPGDREPRAGPCSSYQALELVNNEPGREARILKIMRDRRRPLRKTHTVPSERSAAMRGWVEVVGQRRHAGIQILYNALEPPVSVPVTAKGNAADSAHLVPRTDSRGSSGRSCVVRLP